MTGASASCNEPVVVAFDGDSLQVLYVLESFVKPKDMPDRHPRHFSIIGDHEFLGTILVGERTVMVRAIAVPSGKDVAADYYVAAGDLKQRRRHTTNPNRLSARSQVIRFAQARPGRRLVVSNQPPDHFGSKQIDPVLFAASLGRNAANPLANLIIRDSLPPAPIQPLDNQVQSRAWLLQ